MLKLFAGLGHDGNIRFIGEVDRGAACKCFCPECGAQLLAKQGNEKIWHFAHEGGQERPECEAGSLNLLRLLAFEHLRNQERIDLPPCNKRVTVRSPFREVSEEVSWSVQIAGTVQWVNRPSKYAPVGFAHLQQGGELEIFVEIGDKLSRQFPLRPNAKARVVFWSTLPVVSDRLKRSYAEQHLRQRGQFIWWHLPDNLGLVQEILRRLRLQAERDQVLVDSLRRR